MWHSSVLSVLSSLFFMNVLPQFFLASPQLGLDCEGGLWSCLKFIFSPSHLETSMCLSVSGKQPLHWWACSLSLGSPFQGATSLPLKVIRSSPCVSLGLGGSLSFQALQAIVAWLFACKLEGSPEGTWVLVLDLPLTTSEIFVVYLSFIIPLALFQKNCKLRTSVSRKVPRGNLVQCSLAPLKLVLSLYYKNIVISPLLVWNEIHSLSIHIR